LLDNGKAWGYTIAIIVVAFSGKFIGCAGAAWYLKFTNRESLAIGLLMSCKGLVELIGECELLGLREKDGLIEACLVLCFTSPQCWTCRW